MMQTPTQLYTVDELWQLITQPEYQAQRLELYRGVFHLKGEGMSPSFVPAVIAANLILHLLSFVRAHDLGYVTGPDGGHI